MQLRILLFIFFAGVTVSVSGQIGNNCGEQFFDYSYDSLFRKISLYSKKTQAYQFSNNYINDCKRKADSLANHINKITLSNESKKDIYTLISAAVNNAPKDAKLFSENVNRKLIKKISMNTIAFIVQLENDFIYHKQKLVEYERWANAICRFANTSSINYYDQNKKLLPDSVFANEVSLYDFKKGHVIADVGAGSGYFEKVLAKYTDSLIVYVTEIDSSLVDELQIRVKLLSLSAKTTCSFIPVLGGEKSSNLHAEKFDKIIIRNTFHHFSYPNEMLADLKGLLKEGGSLYVVDVLVDEVSKPPECNLHQNREEFLGYFEKNGFKKIKEIKLGYDQFIFFEFKLK